MKIVFAFIILFEILVSGGEIQRVESIVYDIVQLKKEYALPKDFDY